MSGRKQSSAAAKEANGNPGHRPIPPDADFSSAGAIGNPPDWLDDIAKAEFTRIVTCLQDMDLLHSTDKGVLASYAVNYSRWVQAERKIAAEGTVIEVTGSQGQTKWIKHPALMVSSESQKQMIRAGSLIGLNPVDRNRLSASPKQLANPFSALLESDGEDD
jgi:P27 family predicted phage terminase small subunit